MLLTLALLAAVQDGPAALPVPEKTICRREAVTGSNMGKRVCHTKAEWKAISKARSDAMENSEGMRARGYGSGGGTGL